MKWVRLIIAFVFIIVFPTFSMPPPPSPAPPKYNAVENCTVLSGEFDNVQSYNLIIPAGENPKLCFVITGFSKSAFLEMRRLALTKNDEIKIKGIAKPWITWGRVHDGSGKVINTTSTYTTKYFGLSELLDYSPNEELAIEVTFNVADHERKFFLAYDEDIEGSFLGSMYLSTDDKSVEEPSQQTSNSYSDAELRRRLRQPLSFNPDLVYGAKGSNVRNCSKAYLPPPDINHFGRSLNRRLSSIEIYANPYNVKSATERKWQAKFLANAHGRGNTAATVTAAYLAVADIERRNSSSFSYALGAAESVAGATSLRTVLDTFLGNIDINEYNRGSQYVHKVFNKDSNRYRVKDSCNREPEPPVGDKNSYCVVPERHQQFRNLSRNVIWKEMNSFKYGKNIDLIFHVEAHNNPDDFWVIATIPSEEGPYEKKVLQENYVSGFIAREVANQSQIEGTTHRIFARNSVYDRPGSAIDFIIFCRTRNDGSAVDSPIIPTPPIGIIPVIGPPMF